MFDHKPICIVLGQTNLEERLHLYICAYSVKWHFTCMKIGKDKMLRNLHVLMKRYGGLRLFLELNCA